MKASQETADAERMREAIRLNWRLWTIIQSELLDPASPVPLAIRNNVLSLARFVDAHTLAFLADPRADQLTVLITINRELAAGLYSAGQSAEGSAGDATSDAAPPVPTAASMRLSI
jgi:flagellar protein FlaF